MLARLKTFTLSGIDALPVDCEIDISSSSMPKTILVGLPDTAVKESTHRVERAALKQWVCQAARACSDQFSASGIYPNRLLPLIYPLHSVCLLQAAKYAVTKSINTRSLVNSVSKD